MRYLVILLIVFVLACADDKPPKNQPPAIEETFTSQGWKQVVDGEFPNREKMLGSLMASDTLRGMNRGDILELLGDPLREENNHMFYRIREDKIGLMTLRTRTLVIALKDGKAQRILVHQ